jgi:glycosyltransferase involved in cell wall biosynthesis
MVHIKISIITATLNSANNLENLIQSVIPHLSNKIEFIIIDGKSADTTIDIIKKYSKFLYHWESSSDLGIYDAFNKGIKVARGEFVGFIGSDDVLLDNYSRVYLNAIHKNSKNNFFSSKAIIKNKTIGKTFCWNQLKKGMKAIHPGSLHKKDLFDFGKFFNISYKIASDYDFLVKCGSSLHNFFIDEPTVIIGSKGISNVDYISALKEEYQIKVKNGFNNILLNLFYFYYAIVKIKIKRFFNNDF